MRPADALNSETFIIHLKELRRMHPKFTMILDNAGCRKSRMASRLIQSAGGGIKYLPPYNPQMNPIWVQHVVPKRLPAGTLKAWTSSGTQSYKSCKTR